MSLLRRQMHSGNCSEIALVASSSRTRVKAGLKIAAEEVAKLIGDALLNP
jgi:hypothetical protein